MRFKTFQSKYRETKPSFCCPYCTLTFLTRFTENICMNEQVCICNWNFSIRNPCVHCAIIFLKMNVCILSLKLMFFYYPRFRDSRCVPPWPVFMQHLGWDSGLCIHWASLGEPHSWTLMRTTSYLKAPSLFAETCTVIVVLLLGNITTDHAVPPWLEHILSHTAKTVGNSKRVFTV